MRSLRTLMVCLWILSLFCSCTVFLGNIAPMQKKSSAYTFLDLSQENKKWSKMTHRSTEESSDLMFQSKKNQSTISLNTTCESTTEKEIDKKNLMQLTHELLLGLIPTSLASPVTSEEKYLTLEEVPALQTTLSTVIHQKKLQVRTIVLKKNRCIYDLMYISSISTFSSDEPDFKKFVSSLKIN